MNLNRTGPGTQPEHNYAAKSDRPSAAMEILSNLNRVADLSEDMSTRLEEQLSPVCRPSHPTPETPCEKTTREFPPLFSDMRQQLFAIEESLRRIDRLLDRCEI